VLGVVTDVAHHAAAAAWIVGLAVTALLVIPGATAEMMAPTVRRFSRVAGASVVVLIVTGLIQTVRLVGNPTGLLDVRHGKYLVVKVVVLGAMLAVANVNRRRVHSGLDDATTEDRHIHVLRQAVLVEFALGLAIVAITAAMVVSPPAIAQLETGSSGDVPQSITLHPSVWSGSLSSSVSTAERTQP
jgi:copper transport protein